MDAIVAKLRKMSSKEIDEKIKKGTLVGESKTAAINVLNERGYPTDHFAQPGEEEAPQETATAQTEGEAGVVVKAKKEAKPKAEKVAKEAKPKKEKVAKEKKPRQLKEKDFAEFGKKVKFTTAKNAKVMPETELEGIISSKIMDSKDNLRTYFRIKTEHGYFVKAEKAIEFVME